MYSIELIYNGNRINSISVSQSKSKVNIGRNENNDLIVSSNIISGNHAIIELINNILYITDNNSSNGTFINNQRINPGQPIDILGKTVFLSGTNGIQIIAKNTSSSNQNIKEDLDNLGKKILQQLEEKSAIILGRSESVDVFVNNSLISRKHSKISRTDNKYFIEDLGSMNGTYVNGQRISGKKQIGSEDNIIIGRIRFTLGGLTIDISKEIAIKTIGLVKKFSNGKIGLHETNIEIPSNSLLAVMGPSGCGKSTLLKALNGESPGTSGTVYIGGQELNQNFDYLKMQIGYVPQDDIVHRELTVDESLWYAGKLRLPNLTDEQLKGKINQVLEELNIAHVRSNLVSAVSGGQRKRVSIAVEILTDPLILFLDEPTSPLDPQTIEDFLMILKKLSQKGTTVIMVTHKPEDLVYMDQVIFMAEGGQICYYGKSNEYLDFFNVSDTVKVYSLLVKDRKDLWVSKYESKITNTSSISKSATIHKSNKVNYLSQYFWLTRRYLNIKFNDKANSLIMLAQAPFIAGIICLLFPNIQSGMLFLMAISSLWLGANNAAREIVSENAIFKRERMFNQGILTYIFSKITVLMLFSSLQSFLFVFILYFYFLGDSPELKNPIGVFIWMNFISLIATLMGLLLSATVSTAEKVMSLVPIALIPQIMLAGVITKISSTFIEFFSYLSISRWASEGFNCIQKDIITSKPDINTGKTEETIENAIKVGKMNYHDDYSDRFGQLAGTLELDTYMLGILGMIFFILIYISIRRKDTIQIN